MRISHSPLSPHMHDLPTVITLLQSGTFATVNGPSVTRHHDPESVVYIRVHSPCCTVSGFGQMYKDGYLSL